MQDRVRFVLVHPQQGGNVGSAARAIKNFGFDRLDLVAPECRHLGREARMMSVDARDVLERATVHDTLDEALAQASTVVGTTRRVGRQRRPHWRMDALAQRLVRLAAEGELALVFGREDSGLTDGELDRCTHLVYLPSADRYPSINLAQSVMLVAYALHVASLGTAERETVGRPAVHHEREDMYDHLARALLAIGFLTPDTTDVMMRRFRRILGRAELSREEVKMLRGVARQTLWVVGQAGLPVPPEPEPSGPRRADGEEQD